MGPEGEGQGAGSDTQRRCARRTVEEEAGSSGGEEPPGDPHGWGAEEEVGFPDFLVWWGVVGEGPKQGPGREAEEEGGLRGPLWMEEVEEEEELHRGRGEEVALGAEINS